jgi:DNA invertase Pin-like site-specific DNA recombinase
MFHQFGSFAQYERELIGQRTWFGMMKRLRQRLSNGQAPYGYETAEEKLVPPHGGEAEVAGLIFALYPKKNLGVVGISRELTRRRTRFTRGSCGGDGRWRRERTCRSSRKRYLTAPGRY